MTDETTGRDDFEERLGAELRRHHAGPDFPARELERAIERRVDSSRARQDGEGTAAEGDPRNDESTRTTGVRSIHGDVGWWQRGPAKSLLPAAAALLVFVGGVEYGKRGLQPAGVTGPVATADDGGGRPGTFQALGPAEAVSLPLSIQSAGSEYVATLARFSGTSNQLPDEQREIAREVAMTVLYGAALEILEAVGDDQLLEQLVREIGSRRFDIDGEGSPLPESEL